MKEISPRSRYSVKRNVIPCVGHRNPHSDYSRRRPRQCRLLGTTDPIDDYRQNEFKTDYKSPFVSVDGFDGVDRARRLRTCIGLYQVLSETMLSSNALADEASQSLRL